MSILLAISTNNFDSTKKSQYKEKIHQHNMSSKYESDVDKNIEDSCNALDNTDMDDDDDENPSQFRENVKRFLEEQRWAKAKARALTELEKLEENEENCEINETNYIENDELIYDSDDDEESLELEEISKEEFEEESLELDEISLEEVEEDDSKDSPEEVVSIKTIATHNPDSIELEEVSSDVFEIEKKDSFEGVSKENERLKNQSRTPRTEEKFRKFPKEFERIKSIPNPNDSRLSVKEFEDEIYYAFKKLLPRKVLDTVTSKNCGLCHEKFLALIDAWKHYNGQHHLRAVKCLVKGTYKKHPPFFKMCLEAIAGENSAVSTHDILKLVTKKYQLSYSEQRTNQLITWGIERLVENNYVVEAGQGFFTLDPALPSDLKNGGILKLPSLEMASSARKERGAPRNFSIVKFEKKINEMFRADLPYHMLKSLKPNHCGLCHLVIREKDVWYHYEGSSHRRMVQRMRSSRRSWDSSLQAETNSQDRLRRDRYSRDRERDRYYSERDRESRRYYEHELRSSRRLSRDWSPKRARIERRTFARSPSPKRRRSNFDSDSSPFIHRESRNLPRAKFPVVFIDSSVGGEGPRA